MSNSCFKFKQFIVCQDNTAMKVGVDGVLLGAFVNPGDANLILDVGTGTGLLALMLAQKSKASIIAIDIDEDSFLQAKCNFENSCWSDRLDPIQISFQDFCLGSRKKYDLIVCNPPYFVRSQKSPDEKRNLARHDDLLPIATLFQGVSKLLSPYGKFALIYPFEQKSNLLTEASKNQLYHVNELIIRGTEQKKPNRVILEFSKFQSNFITNELVVRDPGKNDYTLKYKELTSDYYLAF